MSSTTFRKNSPGAYFNDGQGSFSIQLEKGAPPEPQLVAAIRAARETFWKIWHPTSKKKKK